MQLFTEAEVRSLSAERRGADGWPEVPKSIPQRFLQSVLEFRHRIVNGIKDAKPKVHVEPMATQSEREAMQRKLRSATISFLQ
jgi:hypothetical protein